MSFLPNKKIFRFSFIQLTINLQDFLNTKEKKTTEFEVQEKLTEASSPIFPLRR